MAETVRQRLQRITNKLLAPAGLQLVRKHKVFDMDGLLSRACSRGNTPATVIDVGASDGVWSLQARRYFPNARYVLFEPLAERQAALAQLHSKYGFHIVAAAAGAQAGSVAFSIDAALDGSGVAGPDEGATRAVQVETIDNAIQTRGLQGPFCVKLDTHGYEVPVLTGATQVLQQTNLIIVEAYNFTLTPDCLRFHELCAWMEIRGFRCCDLADPMRRPGDGTFWQMDLAFVPASSALFSSGRYL